MQQLRLKRPIVPIEEWINSEYYLGKESKTVYPFWKQQLINFFNGKHPESGHVIKFIKFIFHGSYRTGKTHIAIIALLRIIYEISCFENFPELFELSSSTVLKIAWLSISAKKAQSTGISKLIRIMDSIPYFNEVCPRNKNVNSYISFPFLEVNWAVNVSHMTGEDLFGAVLDEADFVKAKKGDEYSKAKEIFTEAQIRGKCVAEGTRVLTSEGLVRIEDLSSNREADTFIPFREPIGVGFQNVSDAFYCGGKKQTYEVSTKVGTLVTTAPHKFLTLLRGWVEAEELSSSDYILYPINKGSLLFNNTVEKPSELQNLSDGDFAYLVGYWLGDGSCTYNGDVQSRISFTIATEEEKNIITGLLQGVDYKTYYDKRSTTGKLLNLNINNTELVSRWRGFGFEGNSHTKKIPEWVYSSNEEAVIGFLSGYFDADGHLQKDGRLEISTASRDLAGGVQELFRLIGCFFTLTEKQTSCVFGGEVFTSWRLCLAVNRDFGSHRLQSRLKRKQCLNKPLRVVSSSKLDTVPVGSIREGLLEARKSRTLERSLRKSINAALSRSTGVISLSQWMVFVDKLPQLSMFKNKFPQKVERVVPAGIRDVYDLSVPGVHTYVAAGVITHNTTYSFGGRHYGFYGLLSSAQFESSFAEREIRLAETGEDPAFVVKAAVYKVRPKAFSDNLMGVFVGKEPISPFILADVTEEIRNRIASETGLSYDSFLDQNKKLIENIPEDLIRFYRKDILYALKSISGIPQKFSGSLVKNKAVFDAVFENNALVNPLNVELPTLSLGADDMIEDYLDEDLLMANYELGALVYCHVDLSRTGDKTGIGFVYKSSSGKIRTLLYTQIYKREFSEEIDASKIESIFYLLEDIGVSFGYISGDLHFLNMFSQNLKKHFGKDKVGYLSVDKDDTQYMILSFLIKKGILEAYPYAPFQREFPELIYDQAAHKIDHPDSGSKDVSDGLCGACYNCFTYEGISREEVIADEVLKMSQEGGRLDTFGEALEASHNKDLESDYTRALAEAKGSGNTAILENTDDPVSRMLRDMERSQSGGW